MKQIDFLKRNPLIIIFVIVLLFFTPTAISKASESSINSIVPSIGIDKQGEEYEVSLLAFIPQKGQSSKEVYKVVSSSGVGVADAVEKAGLQLGRRVFLFHTQTVIIGNTLIGEDIATILDYLVRVSALPQSCILLTTNVTAKDLLKSIEVTEGGLDVKLEDLVSYNSENVYWEDISIESFYSGYFNKTQSSVASFIDVEEETSVGSGSSGGGSSGGGEEEGSASSGSKPKKKLVNNGDTILFKKGKGIYKLTAEELKGLNWINKKAKNGTLIIKDFSDNNFSNVDLLFSIEDKIMSSGARFENGVPIFSANINLYIKLVEIEGDEVDLQKNAEVEALSKELKIEMANQVKKEFASSLKILRENKTDIIKIYETFYRKERADFKKFLKSLDDEEDFLNHIVFEMTVRIIPA